MSEAAPHWRRSRALYFTGSTVARVGSEVSAPAVLLFGLAASGSARTAALLYSAITVAAVVGGPLLGLLLDRAKRPGLVLAFALGAYAAGLATIILAWGVLPWAAVLAVAVLTGLFGPATAGGWSSQLTRIVPRDHLRSGNALDAATYNLAGLLGPAGAAVIAGLLNATAAMTAAVVLIVAATPAALRLSLTGVPRGRRTIGSVAADLVDGFRPLVTVPALRGATLGSCISMVGFGMFFVACPLLGEAVFGRASDGALLLALLAATALLATVATARWPLPLSADRTFLIGTVVIGLGLATASFATTPTLLLVAVAVVGLADGPQLAALFSIRHREATSANRGQVFTTASSLKISCAAAGGALAGVLAEYSVPGILVAAAAAQIIAVVVSVAAGMPVRAPRPGHAS
ncbi:MFS transporter [Planctomonas deserti]|uniref:MFS transporter n=1 Tax=Planctomonas deserti TaxID=2144185 RepID=UPI000D3CB313|nr:MFS transporter [Planctomonas deserti]